MFVLPVALEDMCCGDDGVSNHSRACGEMEALDITVEEGIAELSTLCTNEVSFNGKEKCNQIPEPRASVKKLLDAANIQLPDVLPSRGVIVTTKKKLTSRRKVK